MDNEERSEIKKFILKGAVFILPILIVFFVFTTVLPINFWTFRVWEALAKFEVMSSPGYFYPNQRLTMIEVGDLAKDTKYKVEKKVAWFTDELGYRNRSVPFKIDILFIGDSFTVGTSLTQSDTINEKVASLSEKVTYQIAPGTIEDFIVLSQEAILPKPKAVVMSIVERNINHLPGIRYDIKSETNLYTRSIIHTEANIWRDRVIKNSAQRKARSFLMPELSSSTVQSSVREDFFFFNGKTAFVSYSNAEIDKMADIIKMYHEFFTKEGITFLFLPIPNKESVYYEYLSVEKEPDFLYRLDTALTKRGVKTSNILKLFSGYKKGELLYHTDDTHWTREGVEITAEEVIRLLR